MKKEKNRNKVLPNDLDGDKYRVFFDSAYDGMGIADANTGILLDCNSALCKMVGRTKKELIGKKQSILHPRRGLVHGMSPTFQKHRVGKTAEISKDFLEARNGKLIPVEIKATISRVHGRKVILGIFRDITGRKAAEEALSESKNLLESVVENVPLMIFMKDAKDLKFVLFNKAGEELLGRERGRMLGKCDLNFFPKKQANFFIAKDRQTIRSGKVVDIPEETILTAKKGKRILHTKKICIKGSCGLTRYLLGISEDITERKNAEKALVESEAMLRTLFETSPDCIYIKDLRGKYLAVNKAVGKLVGRKTENIIGKTDRDIFPVKTAKNNRKEDLIVLQSGKPMSFSKEMELPHGKLYMSALKAPFSLGGKIGLFGITRDITSIKKMESELALAKAAESLKKNTDSMVHGINNALALINAYVSLIEAYFPPKDPMRAETAKIIQAVAQAAKLTSRFRNQAGKESELNP